MATTADDPVAQGLSDLARLHQRLDHDSEISAAVALGDDHILRHVYESSSQVPRVGRLECRVRQPFARSVRRNEILQDVQPLAEIRRDRRLDDLAARLGHQAPHPRQLPDLLLRAASSGVGHRVDRVQPPAARVLHVREHLGRDVLGQLGPDLDDLVVALPVRDGTIQVLVMYLHDPLLRVADQLLLLLRDDHVVDADRHSRPRREQEAQILQLVQHLDGLLATQVQIAVRDQLPQPFLLEQAVDEWQLVRQAVVQDHPSDGRVQVLLGVEHRLGLADVLAIARHGQVDHRPAVNELDRRTSLHFAHVVCQQDLSLAAEGASSAQRTLGRTSQVIDSEHHVLRRRGDRGAVGRGEDVVRAEHQHVRLHLRFRRKRNMHGHLVAVEIGVECRADQRMHFDRLAFHQHRFEGLDAETVQRRRSVQQYRMVLDDVFQDVPNHRVLLLDKLLGLLDGRAVAVLLEPLVDERLEQFQGHLLGQSALVQFEIRADHDHRAARIVHALAQQVLAKPAVLALQRVGQRFQRAVVRSPQLMAAPTVVEERVHRFLQHALLVAHDYIGGPQVHQLPQPVIAIDHAPVQVVEIGCGEPASVQRHQRPQLRRNDRNHLQDHPLGLVAGLAERLHHAKPAGVLLLLLRRGLRLHRLAEFGGQCSGVDLPEAFLDALGSHQRLEFDIFVLPLALLLFGKNRPQRQAFQIPRCRPRYTPRSTALALDRAS